MLEPLLDIIDQGSHLLLEVAVPGILETDIDVTLEGRRIVIRAERPSLPQPYLRRELGHGLLAREVELPWEVEILESSFEDGLLRIVLRRKESA